MQSLLDDGDVSGALNLMIAMRSLIEQAHDEAVSKGILLGQLAINRLGKAIGEAIAESLQPVYEANQDAYFTIVDEAIEHLDKVFAQ